MDFSHGNLKRQGHAGLAGGQPDLPFARLQTALRLRPRRALSSAEAPQMVSGRTSLTRWPRHYSPFDRTRLSLFDRTTTTSVQKTGSGHPETLQKLSP